MPSPLLRSTVAFPRCSTFRISLALFAAVAISLAPILSAQTREIDSGRLTLRALFDSVGRRYPVVLAASSRISAAEGALSTSRAFTNPTLSYQTDQTPFPGGRPLVGLDRESMITATIPLEPFYQRRARIASSAAELRATQADAMSTRQRIALDAANAFFRVATAQVQVETTRDLASWLDSVVAYNSARVREGAASEAELIRATLERDRMQLEATLQSAELMQARAALRAFLPLGGAIASGNAGTASTVNMPVLAGMVIVNETPFAMPPASVAVTDGISNSRSEVRAARERLNAASSRIGIEQSMVFRQIGATIGTMQSSGMTSMIAGISLPLPLFDRNRGEIQRTRAERDAATYDVATQQRMAIADFEGAYGAAQLLTERTALLSRHDSSNFLSRAEESRRVALGAYREGAVPLLQVIDAARTWADSRVMYYRIMFAQQQSILSLLAAEGVDLFSTQTSAIISGNRE